MRGYLGSGEDRDWFVITPTKTGLVMGTVNAPAGVDVIVFRDEDGKKVVNKRGAGDDEQFALEGEAGKPLFIGIARKLDGKKDPKEQAAAGPRRSVRADPQRHRQVTATSDLAAK